MNVKKEYLSQGNPYVLVIGAANIDIKVTLQEKYKKQETLKGEVNTAIGGVARNIAVNLSKLGIPTKLLTVVGDDIYGNEIIQEAQQYGIDMKDSLIEEKSTGAFLTLLDREGRSVTSVDYSSLIHKLTDEVLQEKEALIKEASMCVVDGNLSIKSLFYLTKEHNDIPIFLDPASKEKAEALKDIVGNFYAIKPNVEEAEVLSEKAIKNKEDAEKISKMFLEKGIKHIFLPFNNGDALYIGEEEKFTLSSKEVDPKNTLGAGDAFMAGLIYGRYHLFDMKKSVKYAVAASSFTLMNKATIHPEMSVEKLEQTIKNLGLAEE